GRRPGGRRTRALGRPQLPLPPPHRAPDRHAAARRDDRPGLRPVGPCAPPLLRPGALPPRRPGTGGASRHRGGDARARLPAAGATGQGSQPGRAGRLYRLPGPGGRRRARL
ncbi:MAG: hypothetical protein AVDCRST_MAG88-4560, partial [uncultured Thermomicrobiales bacterium]